MKRPIYLLTVLTISLQPIGIPCKTCLSTRISGLDWDENIFHVNGKQRLPTRCAVLTRRLFSCLNELKEAR